ncbi:MAG: hypothetical protein HY897_04540 [Deltaproteobacteria bacterium]|nr:hypothetical protein [Deltaproteobacteria bacterium]
MDDEARKVISGHLGPDEKLLWCGRPKQGPILRKTEIIGIPLSLLVSVGLLSFGFWMWQGHQEMEQSLSAFRDVAQVSAAIFMILVGRFFLDAWRRRWTFFGLTNDRIIIVRGWFRRLVVSRFVTALGKVRLTEHASGYGTLDFNTEEEDARPWYEKRVFGFEWLTPERGIPRMEYIPDGKAVYDLIMTTGDISCRRGIEGAAQRSEPDVAQRPPSDIRASFFDPTAGIDPKAEAEIRGCMDQGEVLLWAGRPHQGYLFNLVDLSLAAFGVPWIYFAAARFADAFQNLGVNATTIASAIVGMIMLPIGLYLCPGRILLDILIRRRTFYGVSTENLVLISGLREVRYNSIYLKDIPRASVATRSGRRGTITFAESFEVQSAEKNVWATNLHIYLDSLFMVEDPDEVCEIVHRARREAAGRGQ